VLANDLKEIPVNAFSSYRVLLTGFSSEAEIRYPMRRANSSLSKLNISQNKHWRKCLKYVYNVSYTATAPIIMSRWKQGEQLQTSQSLCWV